MSKLRQKFIYILLVVVVSLINWYLNYVLKVKFAELLSQSLCFIVNSGYCIVSLAILIHAIYKKSSLSLSSQWLINFNQLIAVMACFSLLALPVYILLGLKLLATQQQLLELLLQLGLNLKQQLLSIIPILVLLIVAIISRAHFKYQQFHDVTTTSGQFGSAAFATEQDLIALNAYSPDNKIAIGTDDHARVLYLPLCNKLTLSPPGGGKTTSSTIIALLTHNAPAFVFDIKGELWAVTARYRSEVMKRHVVTLDPFGVTKSANFANGKPESLMKEYRLNPFDWVPEERRARDRIMNAFAASFVVDEAHSVRHFDDNAKILIRGFIDYLMHQAPAERSLTHLYELMSEHFDDAESTFADMSKLQGRAAAAANQIQRVGNDERGSILSTSYRQLDWMGDSNIQATLSESNFDLRDFLKGNLDLFIVLPEDQVKEHSRLVRMVLALLMGIIVQAEPTQLPKQKMLFLLDELAQLGNCPDVEQAIEVLRARKVVVWTVFQTLSQIELFQKPDLFKGAPLKQIFTNDDTKTMEWIQALGGKKTILTKTLSNNSGDSRAKLSAFGGQISQGEGESVHETAADLIPLNEIRELHVDEQLIFYQGARPIRCRKLRYFEHPMFEGKFDRNPLETPAT